MSDLETGGPDSIVGSALVRSLPSEQLPFVPFESLHNPGFSFFSVLLYEERIGNWGHGPLGMAAHVSNHHEKSVFR